MSNKVFIALLVLFGVLYLGAVTFGLVTLEDSRDQEKARQDMSAGDNPLVRLLDKPMSLFAPGLLLTGLRCNGQPVDEMFHLTESANSCTLLLRVGEDKEFRRGELKTEGSGTTTWWEVKGPKEQWPKGCREKDPRELAVTTVAPHLIVRYTPMGDESKQGKTCWLKQDPDHPSNLTVEGKGGTLSLMCSGCDDENNKEIRLRIQ